MIDRKHAPGINSTAEINIPEAEKILLDNLIPVYIINTGETEVIKIEAIFKTKPEIIDNPLQHFTFLVSGATNNLLDAGTIRHTAIEIAETFEFYGAHVESDSSADWSSVSLYTLSKFFNEVLPLYHEILTEPVFPENELQTFKMRNKQRLQVNNNKVNYVARKLFNQRLFGQNSAYGYYQETNDYDKIERNALTAFHKKYYRGSMFAIIISGKIPESAITTLNNYFGKGFNLAEGITSKNISFQSHAEKFHEEKKDAVQSGLRIGKLLFNKRHPDYKGMTILNTILGGYFGSRLMSNIREDKGYTYGIGSGMVSLQDTGYFIITTETGTEVRDAALKEIYLEINKLINETVSKEELDLVKNYLVGAFQRSIDGPFALADRLKSIISYNLTYDYFYEYLHKVNSISSEEIQILAEKYLNPGSFIEVTVG